MSPLIILQPFAHGNAFDRRHREIVPRTIRPAPTETTIPHPIDAHGRPFSMHAQHKPGVFSPRPFEIRFTASPPTAPATFFCRKERDSRSVFRPRFVIAVSHPHTVRPRPPQPRFRAAQRTSAIPARRRLASHPARRPPSLRRVRPPSPCRTSPATRHRSARHPSPISQRHPRQAPRRQRTTSGSSRPGSGAVL